MIGTYWIKGMNGSACDGGASYYEFAREVRRRIGNGEDIANGHGICWEIGNCAVILSTQQSWTPRFILIPDSKETKEQLERLLELELTQP